MNKLMTLSITASLAFGLGAVAYAAADMQMDASMNPGGDMNNGITVGSIKSAASGDTALADGVVQKVDRQSGMITIQHGELKNVGMPPMTMAYKAKDAEMANRTKEGEKVKFRLENINDVFTITKLEGRP